MTQQPRTLASMLGVESTTKTAGVRGDAVWSAFYKAAMTAPSLKSFSSQLKTMRPKMSLPGKVNASAGSSAKGQLASLGKSGTSALSAPLPKPIRS